MADPGKIALMLELQLAAGPALETIEKFSDAFTKLEEQVAKVGKVVDGMAVKMKNVTDEMEKATGGSADSSEYLEDMKKVTGYLNDQYDLLNRVRTGARDKHSLTEAELKINEDIYEIMENMTEIEYDRFMNALKHDAKLAQSYKGFMKMHKELEEREGRRNTAIKGVFGTIVSTAGKAGELTTELAMGIFKIDKTFDLMVFGMGLASKALSDFIAAQDKFAKGNYTASGSFNKLTMDMSMYELSLAASSEQVGKAMEAVIGAGIRSNEMQQALIPTVVKMNKAYGVGEEDIARYATTMLSMGAGMGTVNNSLGFASKAIAKAGLSAADATAMIKKMTDATWEFYTLTGSKSAAEKAGRDMAMFATMARDANIDVNVAMDSLSKLQKGGVDLVRIMGAQAITGSDPTEMMLAGANRIGDIMEQTSNLTGEQKRIVVEALSGMTLAEATAIDAIIKKQKEKYGIVGELTEQDIKRINDEIESTQALETAYNNTLGTISGIMTETLIPIFKTITTALSPFFMILNTIMVPFGVIVRIFREFVGVLYKLIGGDIMNGVLQFVAVLFLLRTQFGRMVATMYVFGWIFKWITMAMEDARVGFKVLGYAAAVLAGVLFINYLRLGSLAAAFGVFGPMLKGLGAGFMAVITKIPLLFSATAWKNGFETMKNGFKGIGTLLSNLKFKDMLLGPKTGGPTIFTQFMSGLQSISAATLGKLPLLGSILKKPTSPLPPTPPVPPTIPPGATPAKGMGFLGYMKAIWEGIMVFAKSSGQVIKAAATFGLSIALIAAPILLLAGLAKLLGLSAGDFIAGVAGLTIGMIALKVAMPMIEGLGKVAMGAMKGALILTAVLLVIAIGIGALALAFGSFGEALQKFASGNISEVIMGLLEISKALLIFTAASAAAVPGVIAFGAFAIGLGLATILLKGALLLFPTNEFALIAISLEKFSTSMERLSNTSGSMASIRESLSALKSIDAGGMEALAAYGAQLESIGNAMAKIGAVDIYERLAGNVINNEKNFDKAAEIIKNYADKVVVDLERVGTITPGKAEPMAAAKKEVKQKIMVEQNKQVVESLDKQTTILKELAKKDDSGATNKKLDELIQSMKELVDYHKRNVGTHPASQW